MMTNKIIRLQNLFIVLFFLLGIVFFSCEEYEDTALETNTELPDTLLQKDSGSTTPYLNGTFIDFWYKGDWATNQWDAHMKEMKALNIKILIVQFTAYNESIWCYAPNNYSSSSFIYALPRLLQAAAANDMEVYVGLYFNSEYWDNTINTAILTTHADRCKSLAKSIWQQYSGYTSFKGWYIPHEPAPYYYGSEEKANILKNYLVNPIANYCKSISSKPVAISAFFNYNLSTSNNLLYFMKRLGSCNINTIIMQDGIGVGHCSLSELTAYFNDAKWGLYGEGSFTGNFWADIETFNTSELPESIDVVKQKLNLVCPYVTNIVSYQYYTDMCPSGPNTSNANKLRSDYLTYIGN